MQGGNGKDTLKGGQGDDTVFGMLLCSHIQRPSVGRDYTLQVLFFVSYVSA